MDFVLRCLRRTAERSFTLGSLGLALASRAWVAERDFQIDRHLLE